MNKDPKVIIIGAGVSGLVSAIELERRKISPTIIEATSSVGGRVKTDYLDGFQLDHGFQVLLTAYPEAKHYLNFEKLDLCYFNPGAVVFMNNGKELISDPLRKPGYMLKMIFSAVGGLGDKLKIWQLSSRLKKTQVKDIFEKEDITTLQYLQNLGFSDRIIDNFFKPFFRGIFLEKELDTSSRMFEFVFKMFSEGFAAIPKGGMQKIPDQLKEQLSSTEILFDKRVDSINNKELVLSDGSTMPYDALIVSTQPDKMIKGLEGQFSGNRQVTNLYFKTSKVGGPPIIELMPGDQQLINNVCIMSNVSEAYAPAANSLISVSVIGILDRLSEEELITKVTDELSAMTSIPTSDLAHIKSYKISQALPIVDDHQFQMEPEETKVFDGVYLAGDYQLNGSLNAAMTSGRTAAEAVIGYLSSR